MPESHLVLDIAIVLAVAGVVAAGFSRLRQPSILGYLVVGLLVGPYVRIPLFADADQIRSLSELGVVLVLFAVGLEFRLQKLVALLPLAGATGVVQIAALGAAGYQVGIALGLSPVGAVFTGASLAISSTMVVTKVFEERPPEPEVRRLVLGVLVIQDVAAVILLATLSGLARGVDLSTVAVATSTARLVLSIALVVLVGLLVVPPFVRWVDRLRSEETLLVASIGVGFALVLIADFLDYSHALGAFLGGMLVAESGLSHKVEHLIRPLRDVFAALFFVSVGMSVDPITAMANLGPALLLVVVIVLGQLTSVTFAGLLSGLGLRQSVAAGLALGQIGEFGFIMTGLGVHSGLLPGWVYASVVAAAAITAFTTPLTLARADALAGFIDRKLPHRVGALLGVYETWLENLRRVPVTDKRKRLLRRAITALVIDAIVLTVLVVSMSLTLAEATQWLVGTTGLTPTWARILLLVSSFVVGGPFVWGILRAARNIGLMMSEEVFPPPGPGQVDMRREGRRIIVVALQLLVLLLVGAPWLALTQPFLPAGSGVLALLVLVTPSVLFFWRRAETFHDHMRAGTEVMLHVLARKDDVTQHDAVKQLLEGLGYAAQVRVPADAWVVGKTLRELDLRVRTGATILAIGRPGEGVSGPSGEDALLADDILAVAGSHEAVERLQALLREPPPSAGDD